jgi:hypothetical protein
MPKIYNALQLKAGAKVDYNRMGTFTQPVQFLLEKDKDEAWGAWNMDWLEMQGMKQLRRNARKLLKNYKLANGIIDKSDYIAEEDNETAELIDVLTKEDESAFELKFFPIIPNVVDLLVGEFAKRNDRIIYRAVDDTSYNEMLEEKRSMVEDVLLRDAEEKMQKMIQEMGLNLEDPEQAKQAEQMMSPDSLKTLPEIEEFFRKSYRAIPEEWATHQHNVDEERFYLRELEVIGFRDSIIADREFWHFDMREDDYEMEVWNPLLTFYHKSPQARYISQGNWAGKIDMMTVSDVIDKFGYLMDDEQLRSLEAIYPVKSAGYALPGLQNDGSFYDPTRSHKWNTEGPSLAMRQFTSFRDTMGSMGDDIINRILDSSEDLKDFDNTGLLRVTQAYWKSQRMIGHLTRIDESGMLTDLIVDENFKVVNKPLYDTSVIKGKKRDNLVFGDHVEWIWINHVWGGIKVGPNRPTFYGNTDNLNFSPIYLNVKPLRFQFKGDFTLYGAKLPVEGSVFSDRNTKSTSLVDRMKPFQIGYNLVNNQIADILIDELGTVIVLDQNALPRHSMGEDWGKNNFSKAYVAMKNFQMLPLDTSITNTENALNFQHYQVLNLEQTQRLMSRIQLANHFKQQCFETIGITPQRMGAVNSQETATGIEQAINMSYSQTEIYFTQHSEYLMPRVHQMRTDLAQYYHSNKPSVRLQYMTTMDEKVNFEINGTELLSRDLNVFISTKINHRSLLEQIKQLALSNNTAGASIFDLGNIIKSDSLAEVDNVLKGIQDKVEKARQEEMQSQQQAVEAQQQGENQRLEAELRFKAEQQALDRETDIRVAEIRSAGYTAMNDRDQNMQNDYIDTLEYLDKKAAKDQDAALARDREMNRQLESQTDAQIKRQELEIRREIAQKQVDVARINKNKYDAPSSDKKKK